MVRVLVIEDNPASLDLMIYLLKAFGHTPLSSRDGLEGIETAKRERPDLILCDIQLPGADGIEVCRQLKKDPAVRDIPIVAVTAYAMVGDRDKLLSEGFNGYLSKPINPETFITQVAPYFPGHKAGVQVKPTPIPIQTPPPNASGTILVVDNSPANVLLSRGMLEPFGYRIVEAQNVDEAMQRLAESSPDVILSDVHMPVKDGFDFIELVKANTGLRNIPFIFISSTMWAERERERAFSLGAAQFINRPIDPLSLIAEIEACRSQEKGHVTDVVHSGN